MLVLDQWIPMLKAGLNRDRTLFREESYALNSLQPSDVYLKLNLQV